MSDALSANMYLSMLGQPSNSNLYCIGVGKIIKETADGNYIVELDFRTSSYSQKNQQVIAKKAGLLDYAIDTGDLVLLGQARTLDQGFKSQMDLSVAYILDKLQPAKAMQFTVVDSFDFVNSNGEKLLSITPSGITINKSLTVNDSISGVSVAAGNVKLESHVHIAGALASPSGPVTGSTGGPT